MATYRLTEKACIIDQVYEEGTVIGEGTAVPFTGIPGPHMEPLDDDAKKRIKAAQERAAQRGHAWSLNIMNDVPIERVDNAGI